MIDSNSMIDSKELRIGNWVSLKELKKAEKVYYQVVSIIKEKVSLDKDENTYSINQLEPIRLTNRILEDLGFKMIFDRLTFRMIPRVAYELRYVPCGRKDECFLVMIEDEGCYNHVLPADNSKGCSFVPIESVHQLQNLYASLAKEDMKMKVENRECLIIEEPLDHCNKPNGRSNNCTK